MNNRRDRSDKRARKMFRRLAAYASAIAAATLAIDDEVEAAIVYTDFGPGGLTISDGVFHLDLDHDSSADFQIQYNNDGGYSDSVFIRNVRNGRVMKDSWGNGNALNLPFGRSIGIEDFDQYDFYNDARLYSVYNNLDCNTDCGIRSSHRSGYFGTFANDRGFVGLQFVTATGSRHMAWLNMSVSFPAPNFRIEGFQVFGFAYETESGRPIEAGAVPEPPSLVLLAAGASGLAALRRRRYQAI